MLGWIPDPPKQEGEKPDWNAEEILGTDSPPEEVDNSDCLVSVLVQGGLNSCVGASGIQTLRCRHVALGVENPELASLMWSWYLSRAQHDKEKENSGTYIRMLYYALNKLGFPPESAWPYLDDQVRGQPRWAVMPPPDAFRRAFDQKQPVEYRRIEASGQELVSSLQRASSQRRFTTFGTNVTRAFVRGDFEIADRPGANEPIAGGHAMMILDYNKQGPRVVNSWSENWNDGGMCRMTWDYITWIFSRDFWIAEHVPYFLNK